jgi:type II secretory pathway component PulK
MSAPEHWGVFFRYLRDKSKRGIINEIIACEEGIAMASEVLITVTKEEREQAWLSSREKYVLDTQSQLAYARQDGLQEGKQEIINLLKNGKSPEEIIRNYGSQDS